jgi:hypothetical protein
MSINKYIVLLSLICFLISLNQITFYESINYKEHTYGWKILTFGWIGIFNGNFISIAWLANPALILSWFNFKKLDISFKYSIISLLFSLFFVIYDTFTKDIQYPNYSKGFYFWISSILIMFFGNLYFITRKIKENK